MKKVYQNLKFKKYNARTVKNRDGKRKKSRPFKSPKLSKFDENPQNRLRLAKEITPSKQLSFISETEKSIEFISRLYDTRNYGLHLNSKYIDLNFENLEKIDYCMISVLNALFNQFRSKGIYFRIRLPKDKVLSSFLRESGLINHMRDDSNKLIPPTKKSTSLYFEKGTGRLERAENKRLTETAMTIVNYLTGKKRNFIRLRMVLLEICANVIEWSGEKQQWVLGIKYEQDKVIMTIVDLGHGILGTLHQKFEQKLKSMPLENHEILMGAFNKKYGSKSREKNRNKGLPFVKESYDLGYLSDLSVITNDSMLHFQNPAESRTMKSYATLSGTVYRWVLTKKNIK